MTEVDQKQLGKVVWGIADDLRGSMNADDFRDYMLAFLFLRYLSDNYAAAAKKELGKDYPDPKAVANGGRTPLSLWYEQNDGDIMAFERQMRRKAHYVIQPQHLWTSIAYLARTQSGGLLNTLQAGFKYIENESFESTFAGLFSEINLGSDKLGKTYPDRNAKLCTIITRIAEGLSEFSTDADTLGDAYEYLLGQFAAGSGKMMERVPNVRPLWAPVGDDGRVRKETRCQVRRQRKRRGREQALLGKVEKNQEKQRLVRRRIAACTVNPQFRQVPKPIVVRFHRRDPWALGSCTLTNGAV